MAGFSIELHTGDKLVTTDLDLLDFKPF